SGFLFQAEDGIRDFHVTGVQTCALPILHGLMGLKAIRLLCLFLISGWLGAAVAQDEAQGSEEEEPVAKVSPASRSGFSTGLGEWALARRYPEQAVWLDLDDEGRALGL